MWLLDKTIYSAMQRGAVSNIDALDISAAIKSKVAGDELGGYHVNVSGVLTVSPDFIAMLFGGGNTTYDELAAQLKKADEDPRIERIKMGINSPGGSVAGLFEFLYAMDAASKPIDAYVGSTAASAAYAIAARASTITATSPAAMFGSVGVVIEASVYPNEISITSTEAPNKRPDLKTEEGIASVREELDAVHELLVEEIAKGRGTTTEKVNKTYGRGGMVIAAEAVTRGMIDKLQIPVATSGNTKKPEKAMDKKTLMAQHGDVYAAIIAEGVKAERERVSAHLIMGEASGDMVTAMKAIEEGAEMTALFSAKYQAAAMKRDAIAARKTDDALADTGTPAAAPSADENGVDILAMAAEKCGVEIGV